MLLLAQLADSLNGLWHGNANQAISGFSSLLRATQKDLAYFDGVLPKSILTSSRAGAVLLKAEYVPFCPSNAIVVTDPYAAMAEAALLLSASEPLQQGIHPTAQVHPETKLGHHLSIGAHSVIGQHVVLEDGVQIGSNTVIDPCVHVGKNSKIGNGVFIHSGTHIASEVRINSGCVLGASPFNYLKQQGVWKSGFEVGGVYLSKGVQLGANTVIDRGSLSDTFLGEGVCIDNLVQIAHDVFIGNQTAIAGCAAIGAHVYIGSDCIIGGASCIAPYIRLVDDVVVTGMSTVSKSLMKSGIYSSGTLVHEHHHWRKNAARFKRLDDYIKKLAILEKKLSDT